MTKKEHDNLRAIAKKIRRAQLALGDLTRGQICDLILDNFSYVADSEHAAWILSAIEDCYPELICTIGVAR